MKKVTKKVSVGMIKPKKAINTKEGVAYTKKTMSTSKKK